MFNASCYLVAGNAIEKCICDHYGSQGASEGVHSVGFTSREVSACRIIKIPHSESLLVSFQSLPVALPDLEPLVVMKIPVSSVAVQRVQPSEQN